MWGRIKSRWATFGVLASLALVAALSHPTSATAQGVSASGPLQGLNPWGVGWIGRSEGALPSSLWMNSHTVDLQPLFEGMQTEQLSPAETKLLARVLLSSGRQPAGADDRLIEQRIRLLKSIGEDDKVLDLYRRFPDQGWSVEPQIVEIERDLEEGSSKRACSKVDENLDPQGRWFLARAVCLTLAGDGKAALLALELAQSSGIEAPWLASAVQAIANDSEARPPGRYNTGLETALSIHGDFRPPMNAFGPVSPASAARIARREDASPLLRLRAAQKAASGGLLESKAERAAMVPPLPEQPADEEAQGTLDPKALRTLTQRAVDSFADDSIAPEDKASALFNALKEVSTDPRRFALHARVLVPEIKALPIDIDTVGHAPQFARASVAANELGLARAWRDAMDTDFSIWEAPEPLPSEEPLTVPISNDETDSIVEVPPEEPAAPVEPVLVREGPKFTDRTNAALDLLLAIAGEETAVAASFRSAETLADTEEKRDINARLFYVLDGTGQPVPANARRFLKLMRSEAKLPHTVVAESALEC